MTNDPTNPSSTTHTDILIVGGGMAGASAGYFMADDARVILLERESQPGYHTTGRSAALFFENYGNATIRKLNKATRPFLESPPDGFAEAPLMTPRGAVAVATEELLDTLAHELAQSPSMERVDGKALFEVAPYLDPDRIVAGAYEAGAMDMDVHAILQGFLRGMRAKGGRVVTDAEVMGLTRTDGVWHVETRAGTFSAPIVVNAAGAWCDVVGEMAGAAPVGLIPKRRTAFTFDVTLRDGSTADPSRWAMTDLCDETWYVRPEGGRMMGSPAGDRGRGHGHRQDPDRHPVRDQPAAFHLGRAAQLRRRQVAGGGLRAGRRGVPVAGGPGRLRHPDQCGHGPLQRGIGARPGRAGGHGGARPDPGRAGA